MRTHLNHVEVFQFFLKFPFSTTLCFTLSFILSIWNQKVCFLCFNLPHLTI
ncbi:hypothetical protein HanIR_Chr14g0694201 [Helianthus annuus]|nr:hypothetical protein HanIR_Chr14g0694201 [Helianthus annuus]